MLCKKRSFETFPSVFLYGRIKKTCKGAGGSSLHIFTFLSVTESMLSCWHKGFGMGTEQMLCKNDLLKPFLPCSSIWKDGESLKGSMRQLPEHRLLSITEKRFYAKHRLCRAVQNPTRTWRYRAGMLWRIRVLGLPPAAEPLQPRRAQVYLAWCRYSFPLRVENIYCFGGGGSLGI